MHAHFLWFLIAPALIAENAARMNSVQRYGTAAGASGADTKPVVKNILSQYLKNINEAIPAAMIGYRDQLLILVP